MKAKSHLLSLAVFALVLAGVSCDKGSDPGAFQPPGNPNPGPSTDPSDTEAPLVVIQSPGRDTVLEYADVNVAIRAQVVDNGTIASMTIGGVAAKETARGSRIFSAVVPMSVGVANIVAVAVDQGGNRGADTIEITRPLDAPSFTPDSGTFTEPTTVSLKNQTTGSKIYYTLNNGRDPSPGSAGTLEYTAPITISRSSVLKARAFRDGMPPSQTASAAYTITGTVATPVLSMDTGTFNQPISVTITCATSGATIRYTTDGGDPTESSPIYSDSISVTRSQVIKAKAFKDTWVQSETDSAVVHLACTPPVFDKKTGKYEVPEGIHLSSASPGTVIFYTLDGSTPTPQSLRFRDSILIDSTVTIRAIATRTGWTSSDVVSSTYSYQVATPIFTPDSGVYNFFQDVRLSTPTPGASIFYTLDGSEPTQSSTPYTGRFLIDSIQDLRARAFKQGWTPSDIRTGRYFIVGDTLLVHDVEDKGGLNRIGGQWWGWGCIACYENPVNGRAVPTTADAAVGLAAAHIDFTLAPSAKQGDGINGDGFVGLGATVPSKLMGRSSHIVFWARIQPGAGLEGEDSIPLVVEAVTKELDHANSGYSDNFWRRIIYIGTTWKRYEVSLASLYWTRRSVLTLKEKIPVIMDDDQIETDTAYAAYYGVHPREAPVTKIRGDVEDWLFDVDRTKTWSKGSIVGFRWSVIGNSGSGRLYLDHVQVPQIPTEPSGTPIQ